MPKTTSSKSVIFAALFANLSIAILKLIVSFITRSTAILAESVHSFADTMNQIFLLIGIRKGKKEADALHPFGFSSELYFWSFIVAIIMFTAGAIFSIYAGVQKIMHPEPVSRLGLGLMVLGFSILAEGFAFLKAFKRVNRERGEFSILNYLRKTKRSELIVVFLEDLAALIGLGLAIILLILQHITGILIFDGIASILIGIILCMVALFLGNEIKSLLIGEGAAPETLNAIRMILKKEDCIHRLIHIKSLQLGPDDVMIAIKAEFNPRLNAREISLMINGIEEDIRNKFPHIKKIFVEPDIFSGGF